MSSRKAAVTKAAVAKADVAKATVTKAAPAARPSVKPAAKVLATGTSADALRLAAEIERALADGRLDVLTPQAVQTLMAALCKLYGTQVEAGQDFLPLEGRTSVSPTEIMTTTSALLKAANLAVFELGMWQSWTGR
jgi:hypothetical protein